ncbi:MAG: RNA polymerase sigma factor [Candidatus Zixiibacteriota bacterium]
MSGSVVANQIIETLFLRARGGEKSAQNELFGALSARFQLIAQKRVWDNQDAEEIAQDALMTVFDKYMEAQTHSGYTAWAYKVLSNKILHYYRTNSRHSEKMTITDKIEMFAESWTPDPTFESKIKNCLQKVIKTNSRYGRILVNCYHGYSPDEICDRVGLTKTNFYSILSRARSLLKQCLDKENGR